MATLMTLLVIYGGSAQLAAIPLARRRWHPVWVILATAFCVNLRFAVFSLHLRQLLDGLAALAATEHRLLHCRFELRSVCAKPTRNPSTDDSEGQRSEMAYLSGNCFLNLDRLANREHMGGIVLASASAACNGDWVLPACSRWSAFCVRWPVLACAPCLW
jgi:hypothetical protein